MRLRLFIALAFFGVVGWSYYYDYTTARALQEAEAEADRLDPGWGPEDIESKRAPIPDAANSAVCVLKVAELLRNPWSPDPARDGPYKNSWAYRRRMSPEIQLHDDEARELRAMLKNADGALEEARRLKDLPCGQFKVVSVPAFTQDVLANKKNAHQHVRDVAELLQNDAWLQSHDGRLDSALEKCAACP
jgi:hypothetical protein